MTTGILRQAQRGEKLSVEAVRLELEFKCICWNLNRLVSGAAA